MTMEEHTEGEVIPLEEGATKKKKTVGAVILGLLQDIVMVVLMTLFVLYFVGFRAVIPSGSMEPTLEVGHSYLVSIVSTHFRENKGLSHGDIVVFRHEEFGQDLLVKRVIGLPGDVIEFIVDTVYRNGEPLEEDYLKEDDYFYDYYRSYVVGEGELFVLGDNRNHSADSRYWLNPMVSMKNVKGEMIVFGD